MGSFPYLDLEEALKIIFRTKNGRHSLIIEDHTPALFSGKEKISTHVETESASVCRALNRIVRKKKK